MTSVIGNTAKVYCLRWLRDHAQNRDSLSILDLGCGTASYFLDLLREFPQIRYVGIEPSPQACDIARQNLDGLNATIHNDFAYDVYGRLVDEQFDVIVSFSVFEHVVQRQRYLNSIAEVLKADGRVLMNYDSGHFKHPSSWKERAKNIIGPLLTTVGNERYYQRFVKEADFQQMLCQAGLVAEDDKVFNTQLKGIHKSIPAQHQAEHLERWLAHELWLNELGIQYHDGLAKAYSTRNFILKKQVQD